MISWINEFFVHSLIIHYPLSGPLILVLLFIIKRYNTPRETVHLNGNIKVNTNNSHNMPKLADNSSTSLLSSNSTIPKRKLLIALLALLLALYAELEFAYIQISPTYSQYIPLRVSASKAAEIASVLSVAYTVGRGLSFFVAFKIRPAIMITYHFMIMLIGFLILVIFARNSLTMLWIANIVLGMHLKSILYFFTKNFEFYTWF